MGDVDETRTVTGADLPELAWQGSKPYAAELFIPAADIPRWSAKPAGGLWTSPVRDGMTGWQRCLAEEFGDPDRPLTRVVPNVDALVCVIDTIDDLTALERRYPPDNLAGAQWLSQIRMWPCLSWEKVAVDYDAVWLTEAGQWQTRYSTPGLYGWDCETVLWLEERFTVSPE